MIPVLVQFGPVKVYTYGFMVSIGFLLAYFGACARAKILKIDEDHVTNLFLILVFWGVGCARATYVWNNWASYRGDLSGVVRLWDGGLVFYGGLIGGVLGFVAYGFWQKLSVPVLLDMIAPSVAIGHCCGRLGCFGFGCCFGKPCDLPWAMRFPVTDHSPGGPLLRHPTQLYEAAFLFGLFLFTRWLWKKRPPAGTVFLTYAAIYAIFRFFIEFIRGDNAGEHFLLGLSLAQSTALLVLPLVAVFGFWRWKTIEKPERGRKDHQKLSR